MQIENDMAAKEDYEQQLKAMDEPFGNLLMVQVQQVAEEMGETDFLGAYKDMVNVSAKEEELSRKVNAYVEQYTGR